MSESNKYYQPGQERAARVNDLFSSIAPRYDLINDLQSFGLHRFWKRRLVKLAAPQPGERALDVCCGTGDIAFALARKGAQVTGLDFNRGMLDIAEKKRSAPVEFISGDAQKLPFEDNTFEIVTVGYGLRNLADWQLGLREMWRVAKPGGRLLVLDFARPDNALWRNVYFLYLRSCVPAFGKIFCGDAQAYSYILESLKSYPAQHGVAEAMNHLKCSQVRVITFLGGVMSINYSVK
jgi:demethylmenaquinone methyltransferase / 2-methoxy-6-polyprenyl-1,4-benzoquinol methylase